MFCESAYGTGVLLGIYILGEKGGSFLLLLHVQYTTCILVHGYTLGVWARWNRDWSRIYQCVLLQDKIESLHYLTFVSSEVSRVICIVILCEN